MAGPATAAALALLMLGCGHARPAPVDAAPAPADARDAEAEAALGPEATRTVQRALADRGFELEPSGTFDEPTRAALLEFQRARGLAATGVLDAPTVEALGIDPAELRQKPGAGPRGPGPTPKKTGG